MLHGFACTMLVGIVAGTYSTLFIAATVAAAMSSRKDRMPNVAKPEGAGFGGASVPLRAVLLRGALQDPA